MKYEEIAVRGMLHIMSVQKQRPLCDENIGGAFRSYATYGIGGAPGGVYCKGCVKVLLEETGKA